MRLAISSVVPMGLVDSRITRLPGASTGQMLSTAAKTICSSGRFFSSIGVGTAIRKTSAGSTLVETFNVPLETTFCTRPSRSGSGISMAPAAIVATVRSLISTPCTLMPRLAMSAAVGRPM